MKAVAYVRLSSSDGGNSIPSQISRVENYCRQNNLQLLQTFVDDGKTGWNFDRPGFIDMERFCKANKEVQYLIVPHFDRFSRANPVDAMMKERYLREKLGVKILQVSEPIDTDTTTGTYQIIRFMQAFAANEERNRIVDRTRNGIIYSLSNGRYCNKPPYGYKRARDANGKTIIVIEDETVSTVKFIFKEYLKGTSIEIIRKLASDRGFKIKGNSAIQKILGNPLYCGMVKVPAYKNNPERLIKGIHQAIITESQYWQAQELLGGKNYTSHPSDHAMLRGILRCECGRKMTAAPSQGKSGKSYWYYFCKEHRKANLSAIKLHEQFFEILENLSLSQSAIDVLQKQFTEAINEQIKDKGRQMMQVRHQLGKVNQQIEVIEEKYLMEPDLSASVYKKTIAKQKAEQSRLTDELNKLEQDNSVYWNKLQTVVLPVLANLKDAFKKMPVFKQHTFIRLVFDQFITYSSGSYRTPKINPLFADKALILKEKGLLEVEQSSEEFADVAVSRPWGSQFEHFKALAAILVA